jgi:hypothetical protein
MVALKSWEMPAEERVLVHNFGFANSNHEFQFQAVRFLVEHEGLLHAGAEKTLVVFGVCYTCVGVEYSETGYFPNLWSRHRLYEYSRVDGIRRIDMSPLNRLRIVEKERIAGFLRRVVACLSNGWRDVGKGQTPLVHDTAGYVEHFRKAMGPRWIEKLDWQLGEFSQMIDYLRDRRVRVAVVLLPEGSWEDNLPYSAAYAFRVRSLCAKRGIALHDLSRLLRDDEFGEYGHPNLTGVDKVDRELLALARDHVRRIR